MTKSNIYSFCRPPRLVLTNRQSGLSLLLKLRLGHRVGLDPVLLNQLADCHNRKDVLPGLTAVDSDAPFMSTVCSRMAVEGDGLNYLWQGQSVLLACVLDLAFAAKRLLQKELGAAALSF